MIRTFLDWWARQLRDCLPARLRNAPRGGDAVLLTLAGQSLDAAKKNLPLGRFTLDDPSLQRLRAAIGATRRTPIRLLLPSRTLLEKDVVLPLAAERDLATALRYEMDRLTPFPADAVFWDWSLASRDRARGQLRLKLRLIPKTAIAATLQRLAAAGLAPTILAAADDPARTIPLDGHGADPATSRAFPYAAAAFALLACVAIALPFVRQERAFRRLDAQIAQLRPQVDLADGLRRRLAERAASADVLAAETNRVGDTLRMLAAVTDILPDDTYLFGLTLRNRLLTITGQSAAAAKLIPALAADPAIRDPVFAAPVTRNDTTGAETFTIRAELK